MKRIFKPVCLLLLCMTMLMSAVVPVSAASYEAKGTKLLQQGKVSEGEAIIINIFDYADRIGSAKLEDYAKDKTNLSFTTEERILNEIKKYPGGNTVVEVYSLFKVSAYAFSDLGKALNSWRGTKKEILQNIAEYFTNAQTTFWNYAESAYNLGTYDRNTNKPLQDMANYKGLNLEANAFNLLTKAARKIEQTKDDPIFWLSSKSKNQILEWANVLYDLANRTPSMQAFYNLGRYGSFVVPDDAAFVKTNKTCIITSVSTGKVLNVSSDISIASKLTNAIKLNVYKYMGTDDVTQTFAFIDNGDGSYRIRVSTSKKYLDVYNTKSNKIASVGAKLQTWDKNTEHWRDQSFKFECEDGYYRILLAANPKYCLYVKSNGDIALGKTKEGNTAQLWKILYK